MLRISELNYEGLFLDCNAIMLYSHMDTKKYVNSYLNPILAEGCAVQNYAPVWNHPPGCAFKMKSMYEFEMYDFCLEFDFFFPCL